MFEDVVTPKTWAGHELSNIRWLRWCPLWYHTFYVGLALYQDLSKPNQSWKPAIRFYSFSSCSLGVFLLHLNQQKPAVGPMYSWNPAWRRPMNLDLLYTWTKISQSSSQLIWIYSGKISQITLVTKPRNVHPICSFKPSSDPRNHRWTLTCSAFRRQKCRTSASNSRRLKPWLRLVASHIRPHKKHWYILVYCIRFLNMYIYLNGHHHYMIIVYDCVHLWNLYIECQVYRDRENWRPLKAPAWWCVVACQALESSPYVKNGAPRCRFERSKLP